MRSKKCTPHADIMAPLRLRMRLHTRFVWTPDCQKVFEELKRRILDKAVLVPYVTHMDMRLYVDHGPAGIASTVVQLHTDEKNPGWKEVHHKSRSLIASELNYKKVEGKSLRCTAAS